MRMLLRRSTNSTSLCACSRINSSPGVRVCRPCRVLLGRAANLAHLYARHRIRHTPLMVGANILGAIRRCTRLHRGRRGRVKERIRGLDVFGNIIQRHGAAILGFQRMGADIFHQNIHAFRAQMDTVTLHISRHSIAVVAFQRLAGI